MEFRTMVVLAMLCLAAMPARAESVGCFDSAAVVDMTATRRGVVLAVDGDGRVAAMYPDGECAVLAEIPDAPTSLAASPSGVVFVASAENGTVWRISLQGEVSRVACGLTGLSSLTVDRDGVVLAAISGRKTPLRLTDADAR